MNRDQKAQLVEDLRESLTSSKFVSLVHYAGINDRDLYMMRVDLKSNSCNMKIAKNNLVKIAIKGTDLEILEPYLKGPNAILYSNDPVSLAKLIVDQKKKIENLKLVTGYFEKNLIEESKVKQLAELGSLEEVRSMFIGTLKGVQTSFVRNISFHQTSLVSLIKNYSSQKNN